MSTITSFFLTLAAVIMVVSVAGALIWAVIHVLRGKFREEYKIATEENDTHVNEKQK